MPSGPPRMRSTFFQTARSRAGASASRSSERRFLIDHVRLRPVGAFGPLRVPLAAFVLVFDRLARAGHPLLGGRALGGAQRGVVAWQRLLEDVAELVRPAAVVLDDLVFHFRHLSLQIGSKCEL